MNELLYKTNVLNGLSIEEVFGRLPEKPLHLTIDVHSINYCFLNEKSELRELVAKIDIDDKTVLFPFISITPTDKSHFPAIIHLDYDDPKDFEDLIDRGYGIFAFRHSDICEKGEKFNSGIYRDVAGTRKRKNAPGKLIIWTWAAIRLFEYIKTLDCVENENIFAFSKDEFMLSAILLCELNSDVRLLQDINKEERIQISGLISKENIDKNLHLFSSSIKNNLMN